MKKQLKEIDERYKKKINKLLKCLIYIIILHVYWLFVFTLCSAKWDILLPTPKWDILLISPLQPNEIFSHLQLIEILFYIDVTSSD